MKLSSLIRLSKIITFALAFFASAFAYDGETHDRNVERFLFGTKNAVLNFEERRHLDNINKASYICLDYFEGNEGKALRYLKDLGEPIDIDLIKTPTSKHQRYTHRGWDEDRYVGDEKHSKARSIRKKILVNAIKKAFPEAISGEQENLAKLIYYIHIIGDHEGDKLTSSAERLPLVPWKDAPNESYTIFSELLKILKRLPQNDHSNELIGYLEANKNKNLCRSNCSPTEQTNFCNVSAYEWKDDKARVNTYCFSAKLSDMLQEHLPKILKDVEYFHASFQEFYEKQ